MSAPKHVVITAVSSNVHISAPLNIQSASSGAITRKVMWGRKKKRKKGHRSSSAVTHWRTRMHTRTQTRTHHSQQHAQAAAVWCSQRGDGGFLMALHLSERRISNCVPSDGDLSLASMPVCPDAHLFQERSVWVHPRKREGMFRPPRTGRIAI